MDSEGKSGKRGVGRGSAQVDGVLITYRHGGFIPGGSLGLFVPDRVYTSDERGLYVPGQLLMSTDPGTAVMVIDGMMKEKRSFELPAGERVWGVGAVGPEADAKYREFLKGVKDPQTKSVEVPREVLDWAARLQEGFTDPGQVPRYLSEVVADLPAVKVTT